MMTNEWMDAQEAHSRAKVEREYALLRGDSEDIRVHTLRLNAATERLERAQMSARAAWAKDRSDKRAEFHRRHGHTDNRVDR